MPTMQTTYTYESALAASEQVAWTVDDVIGGRQLDFALPFLPESLARTADLTTLFARERLLLNQIRGHDYLCMFGIVEEFILPFVLDHVRPHLEGDDQRVRAFLTFASEEAKHIELFKRFRSAFRAGFPVACGVIGPADEIGRAVLAHDPLAVALAILHIEWMTQRHFVESVRDTLGLDPLFVRLLRHHWMEEAQHAKLDTLMVAALAEGRDEAALERAVDEYLAIGGFLDAGLHAQAGLDVDALEAASGRRLAAPEREAVVAQQHQALRWTFLGSGMTHPEFRETLRRLGPTALERVDAAAAAFV